MNRYELIYIIDTAVEDSARVALIEKFSGLIVKNGGEIEKVDETWGKRRLAYTINDKTDGYYVLVTLKGPADLPREIERNLEINENIMRYLMIKLVEKKHSVKPRPVRQPVVVAPVVEAPVATPEVANAEAAVAVETAE